LLGAVHKRDVVGVDSADVPVVDEVGSAPLDVWATNHEYVKIELNLAGM
jgi:hypothetical protein